MLAAVDDLEDIDGRPWSGDIAHDLVDDRLGADWALDWMERARAVDPHFEVTEENRPIILETIATFGVDRCMFASNFPVDGLSASWDHIYTSFKRAIVEGGGFQPPMRCSLRPSG